MFFSSVLHDQHLLLNPFCMERDVLYDAYVDIELEGICAGAREMRHQVAFHLCSMSCLGIKYQSQWES